MRQHKVFVYGTLMRGESNHQFLRKARFLGPARTSPGYRLFSVGPYPVLCPGGRQSVKGEVYGVSKRELALLDELEDYPLLYQRRPIATPYGRAWVYLQLQPPPGSRLLSSGSWCSSYARGLQVLRNK